MEIAFDDLNFRSLETLRQPQNCFHAGIDKDDNLIELIDDIEDE